MKTEDFEKAQGHWILARMGKKVLRPGGKELTQKLISALQINANDDIVEFAPGLGFTAGLALENNPKSYVGIDADVEAVELLKNKICGKNIEFKVANAAQTQLENNSKDKVYGEAMLTMHADHRKAEIIREAHRILKKGGLYAIHELGLTPNNIDDATKATVQRDLAKSIKVNARPLTEDEWKTLLENEGFKVKSITINPMHLLKTKRVIEDEGVLRSIKIACNILLHPSAAKRILEMQQVFQKHQAKMNAVAIVAEKV